MPRVHVPLRLTSCDDWCRLTRQAQFEVSGLARLFGVSERHLRRLCKARWGQELHVWLLEQRMISAIRYMVAAGSVKEGARRANYQRIATFTEHFIHYHEITPRHYLKQVRSGRWPADFC